MPATVVAGFFCVPAEGGWLGRLLDLYLARLRLSGLIVPSGRTAALHPAEDQSEQFPPSKA